MSVPGPINVGRAVQTDPTADPTLLRYASAITKQKKCWELLTEKFDRFPTLRNNTQQYPTTCNRMCKRTQHVTFSNVGSCWSTISRPLARSLKPRPNGRNFVDNNSQHCWMLHVASVCTPCCMLLDVVACCCAKFETGQTFQPTTPNISFVP